MRDYFVAVNFLNAFSSKIVTLLDRNDKTWI